jgi:hypothetical protein
MLAAVTVLIGAAAVPVTGAAPGTAAVGDRAVAARVTPPVGLYRRWVQARGRGTVNVAGIVYAVWCGAAGSCAAGGSYEDPRNYPNEVRHQGFVVSQRHGVWGKAIEVPGLGALNAGYAQVSSVSCGAPGSCAAGGYYDDASGDTHGFVVSQKHGVWGKAMRMPGPALSPASGYSEVSSVSCGAPGSCAAGGEYTDHRNREQGFVVSERHGVWGKAIEVPGLGAVNTGKISGVVGTESVSCAPAGSCAAGGDYTDRSDNQQGFVASERNGVWGKAIEMPGLGALNTGGSAEVPSVSCGAAGSCAAGGYYTSGRSQRGFVASERNGVWGRAIAMPGRGIFAAVASVSCGPAGYCAAGGYALASRSDVYGFVVSERKGAWGKPFRIVVPVRLLR